MGSVARYITPVDRNGGLIADVQNQSFSLGVRAARAEALSAGPFTVQSAWSKAI